MNHWLANAVRNLVPLSKAADFKDALAEWLFTGEVDDYESEDADITCELCEHPDLMHHFHIKNAHTGRSLLVGSSCILKFRQIEIRDAAGRPIVDPILRKKALDEALQARIIETSLTPLRRLWRIDQTTRNQVEFFANEIKRDQGLTPRQLNDLLALLEAHHVPYSVKLYKVNLRSYEASTSILSLSSQEYQRIAPALSSAQAARARKLRRED